jgi:hypothetical protein
MIKELLESIRYKDEISNESYYELDRLERDDLVTTLVEIEPVNSDEFLKIKESLTRIGIANRTKKELYQTCLLLHKKGRYFIVHFKELFSMDGRETEIYEDDYVRRNHICKLLEQWGLIKIVNRDIMYAVVQDIPISVYVLPFKEKATWKLIPKYAIGTVKKYIPNGNK